MTMRKVATMMAMVMTMAVTACAGDDQGTAAQRLLDATKAGNERLAELKDKNAVFTAEIVINVLGPIHRASSDFNAEMSTWGHSPPSDEYMMQQLELYRQAGIELEVLVATLDAEGFSETAEDSCDDSCTDTSCGTPAPALIDETFAEVKSPYWKRLAAQAGCTALGVACAAACVAAIVPPATAISPLCAAACTGVVATCFAAANRIACW